MERMQSTWEHVVRHDLSESGVRALTARELFADVAEIWLEEPLDWQFDPHDMRRAVHGAKVVYVCDPNNPTGSQLSPDALAALRDAARETGAWLVADQVYRGAERDGPLTASHY